MQYHHVRSSLQVAPLSEVGSIEEENTKVSCSEAVGLVVQLGRVTSQPSEGISLVDSIASSSLKELS